MLVTDHRVLATAIWAVVAFVVWIFLLVIVSRLGVRIPVVIAAALSWLLAGLLIWGIPMWGIRTVLHWVEHFFPDLRAGSRIAPCRAGVWPPGLHTAEPTPSRACTPDQR